MNRDDAPVRDGFRVIDPGPLTTIQDSGRLGWAHLGVTRSGFLDRASARWANRLVGNNAGAALLETTGRGVVLRFERDLEVAVTGARADLRLDARAMATDERFEVRAGSVLSVGVASSGVRTYLAFSGGIAVPEVLGSRSGDLLGRLGPGPLRAGEVVPVGAVTRLPGGVPWTHGVLPRDVFGARPVPDVWELRIVPGPRAEWLTDQQALDGAEFVVGTASNRVGLRLEQPRLATGASQIGRRSGELVSEPMVVGAVQLPPSGEPVVFLADHPTTGGYPVVAVVVDEDLDLCARMRPGERVRLRLLAR